MRLSLSCSRHSTASGTSFALLTVLQSVVEAAPAFGRRCIPTRCVAPPAQIGRYSQSASFADASRELRRDRYYEAEMVLSPLLVTGSPNADLRTVRQLLVRIGLANPIVV